MGSMKVLLIEPSNLLGDVYKKALEQAGHEVVWSKSAQEAILNADSTSPDVVVLELQLPGHSGVEFLYEFRSYTEWQDIPVVLHTLVPQQNEKALSQLNIVKYLYKPATTLRQLIRAVDEVVLASI